MYSIFIRVCVVYVYCILLYAPHVSLSLFALVLSPPVLSCLRSLASHCICALPRCCAHGDAFIVTSRAPSLAFAGYKTCKGEYGDTQRQQERQASGERESRCGMNVRKRVHPNKKREVYLVTFKLLFLSLGTGLQAPLPHHNSV